MKFIIEPTTVSQWYELVKEAQKLSECELDENLQSYVVITLDKFTKDDSLISSIICLDFLESISDLSSSSQDKLRHIGDRCLLLSGLFPGHAKSMNLTASYFTDIGQGAYLTLAERAILNYDPNLFHKLGKKFHEIADLISKMRTIRDTRTVN